MIELHWYEAYPPRDASLTDVASMMRVLAGRPRQGLRRLQPVVAFEMWIYHDRVRWLVAIETQIARTLPSELVAQLPGLVLVPVAVPERPTPITAREVRLTSMIYPLRLDTARSVATGLLRIRDDLRPHEAVVVQWVIGPGHSSTQVPIRQTPLDVLGFTTARQPDGDEQRAWKSKLAEPLFGVRGRAGAVAGDLRRAGELLRPTVSALSLAGGAHARIYASPQSVRVADQLEQVMPRRTWSGIVNASELAVLVGWCLDGLDIPGGSAGFGLPPAGLLTGAARSADARPLGLSVHPASRGAVVRLPRASFASHVHLIGPSGVGKSTLMANWIVAEAAAGGSLVVIEPKGDLVRDVLARLPQHRHRDVVVIDPGADGPVVGINPLSGPREDAERRADSVLHLMRELFGTGIGPRSADVLLHALIMAARLDGGTLTDVPVLLVNPVFRRWAASRVSDPLTIGPWLAWFDGLSEAERGQVVAPLGNKLRPFTARPAIRRLLGQARPAFDLAAVFRRPTLLLVSLNAGAIGSETAQLVGSLLLGQLWEHIQRQTTVPTAQRRPASVFVDEWQSFTSGLDFADVLARARGANVSFSVAHQHMDQLSAELKAAVLANAASRVAFRPAEGDGRALARVLGAPATPEGLERLPAYHAVARVLVDGAPSNAFEVATPPLPGALYDPDDVRRASARRFGHDPAALDAELLTRWQGGSLPDAPVGLRRTDI
jgi:hypothetical protein